MLRTDLTLNLFHVKFALFSNFKLYILKKLGSYLALTRNDLYEVHFKLSPLYLLSILTLIHTFAALIHTFAAACIDINNF